MDHSLARTLRDAVQAFASAGVHSALIGGSARNLYAPPRATRDGDFALEVASAEHFERLEDVADIEEMVETQRLGGTEPDWEYVRGRGGACMAFARPAPRPPRRGVVSGTLANASHRTSCPLSW